jgi:hypothetical protein
MAADELDSLRQRECAKSKDAVNKMMLRVQDSGTHALLCRVATDWIVADDDLPKLWLEVKLRADESNDACLQEDIAKITSQVQSIMKGTAAAAAGYAKAHASSNYAAAMEKLGKQMLANCVNTDLKSTYILSQFNLPLVLRRLQVRFLLHQQVSLIFRSGILRILYNRRAAAEEFRPALQDLLSGSPGHQGRRSHETRPSSSWADGS